MKSQAGNAVVQELVPKMVVEERQRSDGNSDHTEVVRGFIFKMIGDPTLADDLTQETLLRAHNSESKFKGKASKTTWLCAIALYVMRDHYRATARRPTFVDAVKSSGCKVIEAMEVGGLTNAKLKYGFPDKVSFEDLKIVPIP